MKKYIIFACLFVSVCNAAEKVTISNCYSSMSSKRQKHEITLSNGVCITLQSSLVDATDIKITLSQKKLPLPMEDSDGKARSRSRSPLRRPNASALAIKNNEQRRSSSLR